MTSIIDLSPSQLHRIIDIKEQIEALQAQIASVTADGGEVPAPPREPKKWRMSATARAKIAAAQRARWARAKGTTAPAKEPNKKDRRSSPETRAKLAAAAKARWKKAKAAGKTTL
jgi:hypothetical protein